VNKLELTVSLVFALFLWNWRDLIPGAALMNISHKDSSSVHLDVTYVPEASLSDEKSWSAWQTNVSRSNTTQAYVSQSRSSSNNNSNSSAHSGGETPKVADRGNAVSVTPTQKLWKGESWTDGITIEDPEVEASPESNGTSNGSATSQETSELTPNLLPNFWEEGSRSAPTQPSKINSPQISASSNLSSKDRMTVVSVPVTVTAPSNSTNSSIGVHSSLDSENSFFSNMVPWSFALPLLVGGFGVAGVGYFLLKRSNQHSKAQYSTPHCKLTGKPLT
jgi:hypothetical protein